MAERPAAGAGTPTTGLTSKPKRLGSMAESQNTTIPLELPREEARALAQAVKRIDYNLCAKWSSMTRTYKSNRSEHDVMWSAVCMLERQLNEAGFENGH
jgi:hypothetical protein